MSTRLASRLLEFFEQETDGHLRSILRYETGDFDFEYIRDDVAELYTESELADAVEDSRMESFAAPIYSNTYAEDHGDIVCMAVCFEHVIEMNFVLGDAVGVAVGLDAEAMAEARGLVGGAREIIVEERDGDSDNP